MSSEDINGIKVPFTPQSTEGDNPSQMPNQSCNLPKENLLRGNDLHLHNIYPEDFDDSSRSSELKQTIEGDTSKQELEPLTLEQVNELRNDESFTKLLRGMLAVLEVDKNSNRGKQINQSIPPMTPLARNLAMHLPHDSDANSQIHNANAFAPKANSVPRHYNPHSLFYKNNTMVEQPHRSFRPIPPLQKMPNPNQGARPKTFIPYKNSSSYLLNSNVQEPSAPNAAVQIINACPPNDPGIPSFRGNSVARFEQFLACLVRYCQKYFPEDQDRWTRTLLNRLPKELKDTLPEGSEYTFNFDEIVESMREHLARIGPQEEPDKMIAFLQLQKQPNDTVSLFGSKLLQSFRLAHPMEANQYNQNKVLIARFLDNLPSELKRNVEISAFAQKSTGQGPGFDTYFNIATLWERELKKSAIPANINHPPPPFQSQFRRPPPLANQGVKVNQTLPFCNIFNNNSLVPRETLNFATPNVQPQSEQSKNYMGFENEYYDYYGNFEESMGPLMDGCVDIKADYHAGAQSLPLNNRRTVRQCDYCSMEGHFQSECYQFKARQKDPTAVWCEKCKFRNHSEEHCQAKLPSRQREESRNSKNPYHPN